MITIGLVLYNEEKHMSLVQENLRWLCGRPDCFSVIVVDNASTDKTKDQIKILKDKYSFLYLRRRQNNLGEARQNVVELARGEWVGFLDGDCLISDEWVTSVLRKLLDIPPSLSAFGGPWRPAGKFAKHYKALFDSPVGSFSLPQFSVDQSEVFVEHIPTANVIYRKSDVLSAGGFSAKYAYVGEDLDVSYKLRQSGKQLLMSSDLLIEHYLPESLKQWSKKIFSYGRGRVRLAHAHGKLWDRILILPLLFLVVAVSSAIYGELSFLLLYFGAVFIVAILQKESTIFVLWPLIVVTHFSYALGMACEALSIGLFAFSRKDKTTCQQTCAKGESIAPQLQTVSAKVKI